MKPHFQVRILFFARFILILHCFQIDAVNMSYCPCDLDFIRAVAYLPSP